MDVLNDSVSENAVIGSLIKHGSDAFFDICDMLSVDTFFVTQNGALYKIIHYAYNNDIKILDIPTILSISKDLKLSSLISKKDISDKIQAACDLSNLKILVGKIRKLEIGRILYGQLSDRLKNLESINGSESISAILTNIEFNLESLFNDTKSIIKMGSGLADRLVELTKNPVTQVGISTGYPIYDAAIGGGLRDGSVNVIGARIKQGKSFFLNSVALNAAKSGINVLYLDTEMATSEQEIRCVANLSGVDINNIETGRFGSSEMNITKVINAANKLEKLPYEHINVSGIPFEEQIAIMSRWLRSKQKIIDGSLQKTLIIYDYLKLTTSSGINSNLAEYQLLGFMITTLHNLSVRYNFPILTAVQLNRDGIDEESSGVAAGSDRILWLCANFSIFKNKSPEELGLDPIENGNKKLVVIAARHGPGLAERDYINYSLNASKGILKEGKLLSQNVKSK